MNNGQKSMDDIISIRLLDWLFTLELHFQNLIKILDLYNTIYRLHSTHIILWDLLVFSGRADVSN